MERSPARLGLLLALILILPAKSADLSDFSYSQSAGAITITSDKDWGSSDAAAGPFVAARKLGANGIDPWRKVGLSGLVLPPVQYLRKSFAAPRAVKRATLYTTALGIHEVSINGQREGDDYFNPGWTDYTKRIYYRAYEVGKLLRSGANGIGIKLADGWFAGYIGFGNRRNHYDSERLRARAELHIEYAVGTICPWTIYEVYGHRSILEGHYEGMKRYVEHWAGRSKEDLLSPDKFHCFGDWLSIGADTPKDVIAQAYFANSTRNVLRAARVLGMADDVARYTGMWNRIRASFNKAYVRPDGRIKGDTQCVYVLAIINDLLDPELRDKAAAHLVADIESKGWHLSTGFVGTKDLMPVLGIRQTSPGYKTVLIAPEPGGKLTRAKVDYRSIRGVIRSEWKRSGSVLHMKVVIPPGVTATVRVPGDGRKSGGAGAEFVKMDDGDAVFEVASGTYTFAGSVKPPAR